MLSNIVWSDYVRLLVLIKAAWLLTDVDDR